MRHLRPVFSVSGVLQRGYYAGISLVFPGKVLYNRKELWEQGHGTLRLIKENDRRGENARWIAVQQKEW